MSRCVGVQISETFARVAVVDQRGQRIRVISFVEDVIPQDEDTPWHERAGGTLKELFSRGRAQKKNVVVGLDSGEVMIRTLTVPFKDEGQIRKTIKFELETQITQYAAEDLVVDFTMISEMESGAVLLAAAVPKDLMKERMAAFTVLGVDPAVVDLELFAVVRILRVVGSLQDEEPVLIVHGSPRYAKFVLYEAGQVRSLRTIRFSLPGQKPEDGEAAKGVGIESLSAGSRETLIKMLSKEISRFLLGAAGTSPGQVLLTGEFESPGIARLLQKAIKIPVRLVDIFKAIDHPFETAEQLPMRRKLLESLGLALRGLPGGEEGLDFRQEEFSYTRKLKHVAGAALIFLELLLVLIAAFCLKQFFLVGDVRDAMIDLEGVKKDFYEITSLQTLQEGVPAYTAMSIWTDEKIGGVDYPMKRSALDELAKIFKVVELFARGRLGPRSTPPFFFQLTLLNVDMRPNSPTGVITLTGLISSENDGTNLMNAVKKAEFSVEPIAVELDSKSQKYKFILKILIPREAPE